MKFSLKRFLFFCALALLFSAGALGFHTSTVLAADAATDSLAAVGEETGLGSEDPKIIVGKIIRYALGFVGVVLVVMIVYGGFIWMTASGNPERVDKARKILMNAVIGLIIVLMSWAITSFVISSILGSTGGSGGTGGGGGGGGSGTGLGGGSSAVFEVTGFSPEGTTAIRNIVPRITFSKTVNDASVDGNISVTDASGTAVAGAFALSGNTIRFTPSSPCPEPNTDRFCFDENATYTITVREDVQSTSGLSLSCSSDSPCTATFSSGTLIDTEDPSVDVVVPESGDGVSIQSTVNVQASATDDAGISSADFLIEDEWQDSVPADGNPISAIIQSELSTGSFVSGARYGISVTVFDLAGNEDTDSVSVRARPITCFNGVQDTDLGEEGIDCGGDSTSVNYCGACDGGSCTEDGDCSGGSCTDGACVANPTIASIAPISGAVGTYVTISGTDFGANTGAVLFTDAAGTGTVGATVLRDCADGWSDTQIVVEVPEGAGDGPLSVTTGNDVTDATDDDNGALVQNFDVNDVVMPNLCSLSQTSGQSTEALTLYGSNFGESRDASIVLFSSTEAGSYTSWGQETVKVTVPSANAGEYDVSVVVGERRSNTISYSIAVPETAVSTITDISPSSGGVGQYVTISGTNFGSRTGTVTFIAGDGGRATGSIEFPDACGTDFWSENQVMVIVPEKFDNGEPLVVGSYTVSVTNTSGTTSSTSAFSVTDAVPTPGICAMTSSANVGETITIAGDNFGSEVDLITFSSGVISTSASRWTGDEIDVAVPFSAVTGPVTVSVDGVVSNAVNLSVGATDGTVDAASVKAAYAWMFSTGEIATVPAVVSECSADVISAVPNNSFSQSSEICVNAVVYAEFTTLMNAATVVDALKVEKCTASVSSPSDNPCATVSEVSGTATVQDSTSSSRVTWFPNAAFDTNSTYRVTISTAAQSSEAVSMASDATWTFTTSTSDAVCVVDRVTITPSEETLTEDGETTGFGANAGTGCVLVDNSTYTWDWSLDSYSYVDFNTTADSACVGDPTSCATLEALAEGTTKVTATAVNPSGAGGVSDDASLVVNFTDPYISSYWPNCTEACVNATVGAVFNTTMTSSTITTGDNVSLYRCSNELCTVLTLVDSNPGCTYSDASQAKCNGFAFDATTLTTGSYYRVIVSGEVESASNVPLIRTNYGSDFSWVFRVRQDGTLCTVERISLEPSSATATTIGEQAAFSVTAFGAADSCSASGQRLSGSNFSWSWENPIADDEQNITTDASTAEWYTISGELLDGGSSGIVEGCSADCTSIGSAAYEAVCGDGVLDRSSDGSGEECDDGNTTDYDGCSSTCVHEGSTACVTSADADCCGNTSIEQSGNIAEDCDDGNAVDGDGCSSTCLAEGSATIGATCGNGDIAYDATTRAGEECDDGNNASGDGCSRQCLREGSQSTASTGGAECGDGVITAPYESCDDGNAVDGDGCSSICVRSGYARCASTTEINCCGNGNPEYSLSTGAGEDCDGQEGCSDSCTWLGSSSSYSLPSVCGDGAIGRGEYPSCESGSTSGDGRLDALQVAYIADNAAGEVNPDTKVAIANIAVTEPSSSLVARSSWALSCTATSDQDCADPAIQAVGTSNCCVVRPTLLSLSPTGSDVCRNAAITAVFNQEMDTGSFVSSVTVNSETTKTSQMYVALTLGSGESCPTSYTTSSYLAMTWFERVVATVKTFILGPTAEAAASSDCVLPVDSYTQVALEGGAYKVSLNFSQALEPSATYTLVLSGDDDVSDTTSSGVKSALGAAMNGSNSITFTTGADICTLDAISITDTDTDSPNVFTSSQETHRYLATAVSYGGSTRQEIVGIPGVYDWAWSSWNGSDADVIAVTQGGASALDTATVQAAGENGDAVVLATATISSDTEGATTGESVTGATEVTAFLCENTWPDFARLPWSDDETGNTNGFAWSGTTGYMNFSLQYCQDYGDETLVSDDLPDVNVVLAPMSPTTDVLKEYLFQVDSTSTTTGAESAGDAIGVRILSNPSHLSPLAWYESKGFSGDPAATTVDGFEAVTEGTSIYIAFSNASTSGLYSNIAVISYNEDASEITRNIYEQMLANISFLLNVPDNAVCSDNGIVCSSDYDCTAGGTCGSDKLKIIRDARRLSDLQDIRLLVDAYSEENRACSVTTSQACSEDSECPDSETCEPIIPTLASGTAVRAMVSSAWSSWLQAFGGALNNNSLPVDPLNVYGTCSGYDAATCVDSITGAYMCPMDSSLYHYRAVGDRSYILSADLEYSALNWVYPITDESDAIVTFVTDGVCEGAIYGTSASCGDGVIGGSEICEIGDLRATPCITDAGAAGTENEVCNSSCSGFTADDAAVCVAGTCGDGVVDSGEDCDDGSLNGDYGYCGSLCTFDDAEYCGDGVVSGGEACDCGNSLTYDAAAGRPFGGSFGTCSAANGMYTTSAAKSCSWDCLGPASYCGDEVVDTAEMCDGDDDAIAGKICIDRLTACSSDSDCGGGIGFCGAGVYTNCPSEGYLCSGGLYDGYLCSSSAWSSVANSYMLGLCETGGGECNTSGRLYPTYHTRSCDSVDASPTCGWNAWDYCNADGQSCGNGIVDGDEECDDGNDVATDACTTQCKINVCGDEYLYDGSEECDEGSGNGGGCSSAYGSTCTACSMTCRYTTSSGEFCGDGVANGDEYCDGADMPYVWYDGTTNTTNGTCSTLSAVDVDGSVTYTCRQVGLCNGGSSNGEYCTATSGSLGVADTNYCDVLGSDGGECVMPSCAMDCGSSCPTSQSTVSLLMRTNQPGAAESGEANLYSYDSSSTGNIPNAATITVPACTTAGNLVADVDFSNVDRPDTYVVFVTDTSGSMAWDFNESSDTDTSIEERLSVTKESIQDAIGLLFDEMGDDVHVGLVHYRSNATLDTDDFSSTEDELLSIIEGYYSGGGTGTHNGLLEAADFLRTQVTETTNVAKIIVLLSDGEPTSVSDTDEVVLDILKTEGVELYSIALTSTTSLMTDMDRWSSNTICTASMSSISSCDIDESSSDPDSSEDYNDNNFLDYSYAGRTSTSVASAYEEIIGSIINGTVSILSSDDGEVAVDSTIVSDLHNIALPWPTHFACDGVSEQEVPIQVTFRGSTESTINVSNVRIEYCSP